VSSYVVDSYVRLRKLSKDEEEQNKSHTYTSARTLLAILRLAQALARLHLADVVEHPDVDEALRLMECSKESLQEDSDEEFEPDKSAISQIFRLIKGMASGEKTRKRRKVRRRLGMDPARGHDMDVDDNDDDDNDDDDDDGELSMVDIRARVINAGWSEVQLMETISQVGSASLSLLSLLTFPPFSTKTLKYGFSSPMVRNCALSKINDPLQFPNYMYFHYLKYLCVIYMT
jgi:DNA replication licensing factor MCM7